MTPRARIALGLGALALVAAGLALGWSLGRETEAGNPAEPAGISIDIRGAPVEDCQARLRPANTSTLGPWRPAREGLPGHPGEVHVRCPGRQPASLTVERVPASGRVAVTMKPGLRLTGRVRAAADGERGPAAALAGAEVELDAAEWPAWPGWTVTTDGAGAFALGDLPPPPFELSVRLAGYEAQRMWLTALPEGELTIELVAVGVLDLKLEGATGAATAWVTGLDLWPAREARVPSGSDRVRIEGLVGPQLRAWARTETQVAGPSEPLVVPPGEVTETTLVLRPAPHVRGQVVDPAGKPISKAIAEVLPPDAGLPAQRLPTDGEGRFRSAALFEVPAAVWVHAPGFVDQVVELIPEQATTITLRPTLSVRGVVKNADGEPIADAQVWASGPNGEPVTSSWGAVLDPNVGELGVTRGVVPKVPLAMAGAGAQAATTTSNEDGRFVLEGITAEQLLVHGQHPEYAPASVAVSRSALGEEVQLTLRAGGTLHGTVRDTRDFPVAGIDVRLKESGGAGERWSSSDDRGEFHFTGLRGDVIVSAFEQGEAVDDCTLDVEEGDVVECALRVGQPRAALRVHVQQDTGDPVHGARLRLQASKDGPPRRRERLTGPDGTAVFTSLALTPHRLRVEAQGFVPLAPMTTDPGREEQVEIELVPAGEVAGVVVDSLGTPTSGARVHALGTPQRVVTGDDGQFVLDGLAPGQARIVAELGPLRSPAMRTHVRERERVHGMRLALDGRADEVVEAAVEPEAPEEPSSEPDEEAEEATEEATAEAAPELDVQQQGSDSTVVSVAPGSAGAKAGLRPGDVVTHVDGEQVFSAGQARGMLRDPPGQVAKVRVRRGRRSVTLRFKRPTLR